MRAKEVAEFIANEWPTATAMQHREIANRCKRCAMSERIYIDQRPDGLCPKCARQEPEAHSEPDKPQSVKDAIGDCALAAVLLSGGKDSAYILHRLQKEHPALDLVCVYVDTGFASEIAISNALKVTQKLSVPLYIVSDRPYFKSKLREAFKSMGTRGSFAAIDIVDGETIYQQAALAADRLATFTMISGLTWSQLGLIFHPDDVSTRMDRFIFPLVEWQTGEDEIRQTVIEEDLIDVADPLLSNNELVVTMFALDYKRLGYCSFEHEFCRLVREGKADRTTWLHTFEAFEYLTKRGYLDSEIDRILTKLDLMPEEI